MSRDLNQDRFIEYAQDLYTSGTQGDRIAQAVKTGNAPPPEERRNPWDYSDIKALMQLTSEVCFSNWNYHKKPIHIESLNELVKREIDDLMKVNLWNRKIPGHATRERVIRMCQDKKHAEDEIPRLFCPSLGYYMPNPHLFQDEIRAEVLEIVETHRKERGR